MPQTEPGPYPTKLRFVNPTEVPVDIRNLCVPCWELRSYAAGDRQALTPRGGGRSSCHRRDHGGGRLDRGMGRPSASAVTKSPPLAIGGPGESFEIQQVEACSCYEPLDPLPGKYRVRAVLSMSEQEVLDGTTRGTAAWEDLTLPATSGVVEVTVAPLVGGAPGASGGRHGGELRGPLGVQRMSASVRR